MFSLVKSADHVLHYFCLIAFLLSLLSDAYLPNDVEEFEAEAKTKRS